MKKMKIKIDELEKKMPLRILVWQKDCTDTNN